MLKRLLLERDEYIYIFKYNTGDRHKEKQINKDFKDETHDVQKAIWSGFY